MALLDMIREYQELLTEKDGLAEATKTNNKAIEEMKQQITQQMIDDDCPRISYAGYSFSLSDKTEYRKKSEEDLQAAGLDFFEVLREQGLGDIITETVNARTLSSTVKGIVEESGALPEELADILNVWETSDIIRRKETNRALQRAKGEA
nr:hypothetical protein [uncultured Dysosmobacter sp.]